MCVCYQEQLIVEPGQSSYEHITLHTASCSPWPEGLQQHGEEVYDSMSVRDSHVFLMIPALEKNV